MDLLAESPGIVHCTEENDESEELSIAVSWKDCEMPGMSESTIRALF